jgi:phosphate transport system substrate-binding protein
LNERRRLASLSVVAVLGLLSAGCNGGGGDGGGDGGEELTGRIVGDGSSTVFPITEAVAEEFRAENPGIDITVGTSGTGGGFEKFCNDETDIQNASRPIEDDEKQACSSKGVEYTELTMALDGLAVVVNTDNDFAKCLTTAELKKIWEPGSTVNNWKDVKARFPDRALKLFGPGTDSGTFDYFTDVINGEEGASRTDYTPSEDDNVLVQGVEGDEGAMGYFGYAYYKENQDQLNLVAVNSGGGCINPSDETVQSGTYKPLSRPLLVYAKKASLDRPEVRAFIDFYLDNVNELLGDVGYTPLSEDDLQAEKEEFEQEVGDASSPGQTGSPASGDETASPGETP